MGSEQHARRPLASCDLRRSVHECRHFVRQHSLRLTFFRRFGAGRREGVDSLQVEKRKALQIGHDVAIIDVQPELIELER
jgi:hypothetical protein